VKAKAKCISRPHCALAAPSPTAEATRDAYFLRWREKMQIYTSSLLKRKLPLLDAPLVGGGGGEGSGELRRRRALEDPPARDSLLPPPSHLQLLPAALLPCLRRLLRSPPSPFLLLPGGCSAGRPSSTARAARLQRRREGAGAPASGAGRPQEQGIHAGQRQLPPIPGQRPWPGAGGAGASSLHTAARLAASTSGGAS